MFLLLDAPPPWHNVTVKDILTELELGHLVELFEREQVRESEGKKGELLIMSVNWIKDISCIALIHTHYLSWFLRGLKY